MNSHWIEHLGLGAGLVLLASVALLLMVYRELAPTGGLSGRGRLLLTAGVGLGVLSFATKVAALAVMVAVPGATIAPLSNLHQVERTSAKGPYRDHRHGPAPVKTAYAWQALPEAAPAPDGAGSTPEWVALGRQLFNDKALSLDHSLACASCHDVALGAGTDRRATSEGIAGQIGNRNAPTVWNAAFQARQFWDGRAPSLEEQAKGPPVNPVEMGMHSLDDVVARVEANPAYRAAFAGLLGEGRRIGIDDVAAAIAAYERTLITPDAPYDRYLAGDRAALDAAQVRGMALFESVGCVVCHHGPNFSSASLFDARMPYRLFPAYGNDYIGRYRLGEDRGRAPARDRKAVWKVPSLRNVALTAPYFHNGSVDNLEEAVRIMATSQLGRRIVDVAAAPAAPRWSPADRALHRVQGRDLTEAEVRDIAAFLRALSSGRLAAAMAAGPRPGV